MTKLNVIIEGYAKEIKGGWKATSTTVFLESNKKKIIVDPGIHKVLLLDELKKKDIKQEDIDIVFITHYHPDHAYLASLFEKSYLIDGDTIFKGDIETGYKEQIPETEIKVIPTPGHSYEHCSLLVGTKKGSIVIAGDVFWWMDNEKQDVTSINNLLGRDDPFAVDKKELLTSREKILKQADFVIPGHGEMFKVD